MWWGREENEASRDKGKDQGGQKGSLAWITKFLRERFPSNHPFSIRV